MKRKSFLGQSLFVIVLFIIAVFIYLTNKNNDTNDLGHIHFVSSNIFNRSIPVINNNDFIISPYNVECTIGRYFYNKSDDTEKKKNSLIVYKDTYIPNTGVDFVFKDSFNVMNIYEGTVMDVKKDDMLGNIVEIRHNSELISVYSGLNSVDVKKGDVIRKSDVIGSSGVSKINESLGNHLHLEISYSGKLIDPLSCIGKEISSCHE